MSNKTNNIIPLVVTCLFAGSYQTAWAADETTNSDTAQKEFELEVIQVTARRRVESLQDTPISITAIQGNLLEEMGVADLTGIANVAPNVSFSTTGTVSGSSSSAVVYIRGIGQNDYVPVVDPGVGIYVDDVYLGRTVGSVLDLADIQSIEIVRGPQGTLFGRNTIGGAISIATNDADGETGGRMRAILGNQGREEVFGTFKTAFSDDVTGIFNVMSRERDGTVTRINVPGSEKLGNENSEGGRFKLNFQATDRLSFKLIGDIIKEREESAPEVNAFFNDDRTLTAAWNGYGAAAGLAAHSTAQGCVQGDPTQGINCYNESQQLGPFTTGETSLSQNDIDTWGLSLTSMYEINDNLTAKLIVAYRDLEADFARQVDGSPLNIFENRESYESDQTSFDFRLNGYEEDFTWVAGAFYYEEDSDNQLDFSGAFDGTLYPIHVGGTVDNSNYAFYAEGTWDIRQDLHFTAGIRYTDEEKNATPNAFAYPGCSIETRPTSPSDACDSTLVDIPRRATGTSGYLIDPVENTIDFDEITWRIGLAWDIDDTTSLYGTVSTGFKSGGFEWRVTNTSFTTPEAQALIAQGRGSCGEGNECLPTFDPETVTTYEVGLKADITQDLRLNTAIFYSDFEDMIVAANQGGIATFQTNAAKSTIQGLETELTWVPTDSLLINASVGYIDAEYDEVSETAQAAGITTEDDFVFTPELTASLGVSYIHHLEQGGYLTTRLDGIYKSEQEFEAANTIHTRENGYHAWNTSLKYTSQDDHWHVSLGVENLTDERYKVGGDANSAIGYENVIYARPRSVFLTFEYEWF